MLIVIQTPERCLRKLIDSPSSVGSSEKRKRFDKIFRNIKGTNLLNDKPARAATRFISVITFIHVNIHKTTSAAATAPRATSQCYRWAKALMTSI